MIGHADLKVFSNLIDSRILLLFKKNKSAHKLHRSFKICTECEDTEEDSHDVVNGVPPVLPSYEDYFFQLQVTCMQLIKWKVSPLSL